MADDGQAPAPTPAEGGSQEQRLERVETAVTRIENALSHLVPGSHAEAQEREEQRLDRPNDVAQLVRDQTRAELQRAEQEQAAARAAESEKAERETMAQRLAKLEETPPATPRPRLKRLIGGWG